MIDGVQWPMCSSTDNDEPVAVTGHIDDTDKLCINVLEKKSCKRLLMTQMRLNYLCANTKDISKLQGGFLGVYCTVSNYREYYLNWYVL